MHCCFDLRSMRRRQDRSMERVALLRRGLVLEGVTVGYNALEGIIAIVAGLAAGSVALTGFGIEDRKSTRLNSSHGYISYAVFCLKKKKRRHSSTRSIQ